MKAYVETSYDKAPSIFFNISGRGQKDIESKVQRFVNLQYARNDSFTIHWNKKSALSDGYLIANNDGGFRGVSFSQKEYGVNLVDA